MRRRARLSAADQLTAVLSGIFAVLFDIFVCHLCIPTGIDTFLPKGMCAQIPTSGQVGIPTGTGLADPAGITPAGLNLPR